MSDDTEPHDMTLLLDRASQGSSDALNEAFPLLLARIHAAAQHLMKKSPAEMTLQATGLMHEACMRAAAACAGGDPGDAGRWENREHFILSQVLIMKHLLLSEGSLDPQSHEHSTLFINDACEELAVRDPMAAKLAQLHYFGSFTWSEAGELLGLSDRKRKSLRQFADAWFLRQLGD